VEMTYARWREDGFDADFVASELAKGASPLPSGGLQFSGGTFFGEPLILLETGVEFLVPISDVDRSRIIDGALEAALRSKDYGPSVLIGEINKATRDFARSPETKYVVATGLSFRHFEDLSRIEGPDPRLYVRRRLPRYLVEARREAKQRTGRVVGGDYPEDVPFKRYAPAWIHVRGRSTHEAIDRAVEALDLRRGIWNFALNRGTGATYPPPTRGPINEVLAGPIYSLHHQDGALAADYDWVDPEYTGPRLSRKVQAEWARVLKDEEDVRAALKRSPYRATLEDALRRYCRSLDSADLSHAFLNLWGLLETLTGISPQEGHDSVVKRASFIFVDGQRKTHEQVLHHLRRHRNSYVHAGEGANQAGAYLHQIRRYVEQMLLFHLMNSRHFSSMDRATRFLDLPSDTRDLRHFIETREEEATRAAKAARLAREGLRFREGD
jgi:hypothetical protein